MSHLKNHQLFPKLPQYCKGFDTKPTFRETNSNEVMKLAKTLDISKACQNTDYKHH